MAEIRLAWLSSHHVQNQAPSLRANTLTPDIDLNALFFSDFALRKYVDS